MTLSQPVPVLRLLDEAKAREFYVEGLLMYLDEATVERLLASIAAARHGWQGRAVVPGEPEANFGRWAFPVLPRNLPGMPRAFFAHARRADAA